MSQFLRPETRNPAAAEKYQDGLRRGRLLLQQCRDCGQFISTPSEHCPFCSHDDFRWVESTGWGILLSVQGISAAGRDQLHYRIALDEGVEIEAGIAEPPPTQLRSGMKVLGHVSLKAGQPELVFNGHSDEDEW